MTTSTNQPASEPAAPSDRTDIQAADSSRTSAASMSAPPASSAVNRVRAVGWCLAFVSTCFCGWMVARLWQQRSRLAQSPGSTSITASPGDQSAANANANGGNEPDLRPRIDRNREIRHSTLSPLQDFRLLDSNGKIITRDDLLGHPWAVNFIFSRCAGECLRLSAVMNEFQDRIEDLEVRLVSITVDPEFDRPEVLRNYADSFGAKDHRWYFLTADDRDYLYGHLRGTFRQLVMEMEGNNRRPGYEFLHTSNVLHISAEGRIVGNYNGLDPADMVRLEDALREEIDEMKAAGTLKPLQPLGRDAGPAVAERPE